MYHSGDDVGAIVADIGSFSTRIGHAGDDVPAAYFPSVSDVSCRLHWPSLYTYNISACVFYSNMTICRLLE
jgi:actin-related protein